MRKKLRPVDLEDRLRSFSDEQLLDSEFLTTFIMDEIGLSLNTEALNIKNTAELNCWRGFRCKQYPNELAQLLVFLRKHRKHIKSYLEIGIERAGTFMLIDGFLRVGNKDFKGSVGIDIALRSSRRFDDYRAKFPSCKFVEIKSQDFYPSYTFDFCFIDGDHLFEGIRSDVDKMLKHAKVIALHDIVLLDGPKRVWEETKASVDKKHITEIYDTHDVFPGSVGIGIYHPSI